MYIRIIEVAKNFIKRLFINDNEIANNKAIKPAILKIKKFIFSYTITNFVCQNLIFKIYFILFKFIGLIFYFVL